MDYSSPPCPARHKWPVAVACAAAVVVAAAFVAPLRAFALRCYCCRHRVTDHAFDASPDASQQCASVMWATLACTWREMVILEVGMRGN